MPEFENVQAMPRLVLMLVVALPALALAGCSDPKAVQTFAGMAPDQKFARNLTAIYVDEPPWRQKIEGATGSTPGLLSDRSEQAKGIIADDAAIRSYMQSLGALAADGVVQAGPGADAVKSGLEAWQKADPALGITPSDVTLISSLVHYVGDLALAGYRDAKVASIVAQYEVPFQTLLDTQIKIMVRGVQPSIQEYSRVIGAIQPTIKGADNLTRYAVERELSVDQDAADEQLAAAEAYVTALRKIKEAHTDLYKNRDRILTKAMLEQIQGPASDAYKAFQTYEEARRRHT